MGRRLDRDVRSKRDMREDEIGTSDGVRTVELTPRGDTRRKKDTGDW